ncbi:MAG TPA: malate synthase A [Longimicrobiales bacterium]|nr:malate synthase A [Longimicrobiales bacterium]
MAGGQVGRWHSKCPFRASLAQEEQLDLARVLTPEAVVFLEQLHREFEPRRQELLRLREERAERIRSGERPKLLDSTRVIKEGDWRVAAAPPDLDDRRVEITGPTDAKMVINALNSGARVFMADFEDSLSPTWQNVIEGQINLQDAVRRQLSFTSPEGKQYQLKDELATLVVRPRGWHLHEKHFLIDDVAMSGSLFDFGLYFFHNARELLDRGSGPYFYLPKMESHLEARLWNDVFEFSQKHIGIPNGSIRATVLIETILAAFEMEEILYELRDHAAGLNAGRWDYIFSIIKKFGHDPAFVLPDRAQVTMAVPFMRAYAEMLVRICHKRGAHAIGGMAAFIPSRRDVEVNERAMAKVREDKKRESGQGFDGTWVAHPDLVPVAMEIFDSVLGSSANQKALAQDAKTAKDAKCFEDALLNVAIDGRAVTAEGVTSNIAVALRYIDAWLQGTGAVAIYNLMEDAATAEISRAQLWQWRTQRTPLAEGGVFDVAMYQRIRNQQFKEVLAENGADSRVREAAALLDDLVLNDEFQTFLTLPGYEQLA